MWLGLAMAGMAAMLELSTAAMAGDGGANRYAGAWSAELAGAAGACRIELLRDRTDGRLAARPRSCAAPLARVSSWEPGQRGFTLRDAHGRILVAVEPVRGHYIGRMADGALLVMRPRRH